MTTLNQAVYCPFTATPPVSRIDAKRGQTIKLMYTASSALPKDRESVFWFNVLEVPQNQMQQKQQTKACYNWHFAHV